MKYEVNYKLVVDANSKEEAQKLSNNRIRENGVFGMKSTCTALCPYGHIDKQVKGACYEKCQYRDNGICTLN